MCRNGTALRCAAGVQCESATVVFGSVLLVIKTITFDSADDPLQLLALVAVGSAARAYLQRIIRTVFRKELHGK